MRLDRYFKDFLPQAAAEKDPVERMKLVVSCFIASISLTSGNFLKPLNPILGETLQASPSKIRCSHSFVTFRGESNWR